jgi:hypothetical protein
MNQIDLDSWESFENELKKLESLRQEAGKWRCSPFLFRGHAESGWTLRTTYERYLGRSTSFREYFKHISAIRGQIETFTGTHWDIPTFDDYVAWLDKTETFTDDNFLGYDYMLYLRHHGFPSPLIDWTRSPYIAAFFAFSNLFSKAERVSIFAFIEHIGDCVNTDKHKPHISGLGPYTRGNKRHFSQQSEYTVCSVIDENEWFYAYDGHEDVIARGLENQNVIWKFTLPSSERQKVLYRLQQFNINAFSLYGSEGSLIDTIIVQEFLLHGRQGSF